MTRLKEIRTLVNQVAEAIAAVLCVEVLITDSNYEFVAGTHWQGKKLLPGCASEKVLAEGEKLVLREPKNDDICVTCQNVDSCTAVAALLYPIVTEERIFGVIGLEAYNRAQRKLLLTRTGNLFNFLNKMSDMIISKVKQIEIEEKQLLTTNKLTAIIDSVKEGIIILDQKGLVTLVNRTAARILNLEVKEIMGHRISDILPGTALPDVLKDKNRYEQKVVTYQINDKPIKLVETATPVKINGQIKGVVSSFNKLDKIRKIVYEVDKKEKINFSHIIGNSRELEKVKKRARVVAQSDSTVLILGESGTGKELFARAIHNESNFSRGNFVDISCAAIPENLLESELFGYEEGAFTGARKKGKKGKLELANNGTLFLDEIGDMSLNLQVKLLRVLQEREFEKVGGHRKKRFNARIISATHRDLETEIERGNFREDLFYRLNVIPITIPPLRERGEDIILLARYFLQKYNDTLGKNIHGFTDRVKDIFFKYKWPGNVRELKNTVEYAVNIENEDYIGPDSIPSKIISGIKDDTTENHHYLTLVEKEKKYMKKILADFGSSVKEKDRIAEILGISRATLYRKMNKHGLN